LLDSLSVCIIGGASVSENLKERLKDFTVDFYATYGMTETISHIALQKLNGDDASDFFETLPGISIRTDNRNCLLISTSFLNDEVITNDIVEISGKNSFKWIGRWDNIINSGGIKLSPEDLEARIGKIFTRLNINAAYFIHGIPDEKLGNKVVLVVEGNFPDASVITSIHEVLPHSFSAHEIPKEIYFIPRFIYTETSKINRTLTVNSPLSHSIKIR
jgi:O-succinylbenzoic acid--CoA ligase